MANEGFYKTRYYKAREDNTKLRDEINELRRLIWEYEHENRKEVQTMRAQRVKNRITKERIDIAKEAMSLGEENKDE